MHSKPVLGDADVKTILAAAENHVDDGGHLLGLSRLDGAAPISPQIATGKAQSAALGRRETKSYEEMINGVRASVLSMPLACLLEGGVPVVFDGQVVGAVRVSGVKSAEDAEIANVGIAALGLS